ncbi:MAG: YtxH domain-containing protein [Gemmatimonadota bacterium]
MDDQSAAEARGLVAGIVIGVLVGAAAALLTAPHSGQRTRRLIARRAEDWSDSAGESLEAAADDARRLADRAARDARRAARRARDAASDVGTKLAGVVERERSRLET